MFFSPESYFMIGAKRRVKFVETLFHVLRITQESAYV